jgi:hypothetical protein
LKAHKLTFWLLPVVVAVVNTLAVVAVVRVVIVNLLPNLLHLVLHIPLPLAQEELLLL